jgi:hypothetical protein
VDLAKLVVRLEAQSAQLLTELEKANKRIDRFASQTHKTLQKWSAGLLTFFSARAIFNFSKDVIKAQGDLVSMAEVAGTSVENLSSLGFAAEQSSSSLEGLNKGLGNLANTAASAAKGSKDATEAFAILGIEVEDGNGRLKDSSDLLLEVAEQFAQYEDGAAKSALAQDLFGKSGKELIPLLNRGAAGIKELQEEADRLGVTVGTDAANASNTLNDNLTKLQRTAGGLAGQVLAPLVETLNGVVEAMLGSAQGSRELEGAGTALVVGLKLIADIGSRVWETFSDLGNAFGALAAAAVAAATGDFRRAYDIIQAANEEGAARDEFYTNFRAKLWEDAGAKVVATAKNTDAELKKTLAFGTGESALEEVNITLEKIEPTAMEDFYAELDKLTATTTEKARAAYAEMKVAVDALFEDGKISAEQYAARLEVINKQLEDGLGITQRQEEAAARLKKVQDEAKAIYEATRTPLEKYNAELVKLNNLLFQGAIDQDTYNRAVEQSQAAYDKATDGAAAFYAEAKENAQDILGQGIYDTLKDGFDRGAAAALDTFADMLLRMATEALAADLMGSLFGTTNEDGTSTGGLIQAGLALFGGGRASEGAVNPGVAYDVGENGPERFVPSTAGRIEDQRRWGGSRNNIYVTVEAPKGTVSRQTQLQTGSTIAKQIGHANRRNN